MDEKHVTVEEVWSFVEGSLPPERRRELLTHLFRRCPDCLRCTAILEPFLASGNEPLPTRDGAEDSAYDAVIGRCTQSALASAVRRGLEIKQRTAFLARVKREDSIEEILAKAETKMLIRPLIEALLQLSFDERARHPGRMLALAVAASCLAANLQRSAEARLFSAAEGADLLARALGELANAYRVNGDFAAAEETLARAEVARAAGSDEPLLLARLLNLQASLRTSQRRFPEAYKLLGLVYNIYDRLGERHLAGRALLSLGNGLFYDGALERAAEMLRLGLSLIASDGDPQLLAMGRQSLLYMLAASGKYAEAAELLLRSGLREALPDPLNQLKVRWLEARIYAGLGKRARAEAVFQEIQAGFTAAGAEYEASLVRLELAGLLVHDPLRFEQVKCLAEEAYETFHDLEVGREGLRAVRYLQEACFARAVTASMVRDVVVFLERLSARPDLRFGGEGSV